MSRMISKTSILLGAFVATFPVISFAQADESSAELEAVRQKVSEMFDMIDPEDISASPVDGWYTIHSGSIVAYISADGRYIVSGSVIDMESKQNLTEQTQQQVTKKVIDDYDEKKMIVFAPKGKTNHTITVFTDVDCPYCSMLHKEVPKLNEAGISVRYLMYPRAGAGTPTFNKSISTWCNKDQKTAITVAKEGGAVEPKTCDNPVQEQFDLGQAIGVTGTPTLVLESGKVLPGCVPAAQLIDLLDGQA